MLPHQQADFVRHIAIDIGGSLIKLVYFSPEDAQAQSGDASEKGRNHAGGETAGRTHRIVTGSLPHPSGSGSGTCQQLDGGRVAPRCNTRQCNRSHGGLILIVGR